MRYQDLDVKSSDMKVHTNQLIRQTKWNKGWFMTKVEKMSPTRGEINTLIYQYHWLEYLV